MQQQANMKNGPKCTKDSLKPHVKKVLMTLQTLFEAEVQLKRPTKTDTTALTDKIKADKVFKKTI